MIAGQLCYVFFFFNDTATTEIYTLSLHDALPILIMMKFVCLTTEKLGIKTIVSLNPIMVDGTGMCGACRVTVDGVTKFACVEDRKSTRLNSSHANISYAVFCLKKKKHQPHHHKTL